MTLAVISLLAAGCGGGSDDDAPPPSKELELSATSPPTETDCGFTEAGLDDGGKTTLEPAAPGVYRYTTSGSASGDKLPATSTMTATPARKQGSIACIGTARKLSDRVTTGEVYLLRGEDIYAVALGASSPNLVETVRPRPAILAMSGTETSWTGEFSGPTTGTYTGEIIGRRSFRIDGRSVRAVGIESRANYRGEASGTRESEVWIQIDGSLVLQERTRSELRVGGTTEKLDYTVKLASLEPEGS